MCSSPQGCQVEGRKGMKAVGCSTHAVPLTPLCQVTKPVAQAAGAAAQMTSVPPSLILSPPKHHRSTRTGGRWMLQPHSLAGHCRRCSSSSSALYCKDSGDNPGSSQRNCVLATETANFLLFLSLGLLDSGPRHKHLQFSTRQQYCNLLPILVFPKSTRCQTELLPAFFRSLKTISTLERILSQLFITGDFLSFISFYAAKGKKDLTVCVFPQWEKIQGKKLRKFSFWIKPDSRLLHFNRISTKQRRKEKKKTRKEQKKCNRSSLTARFPLGTSVGWFRSSEWSLL